MNSKLFALCALLLLLSSTGMVQATSLLVIDRMVNQVSQSLLIYTVPSYGVGSTWYSPYSDNSAPPQFRFVLTSDAVGGQRDIILGYVAGVPVSSTAIMGTNLGKASISFPLAWVGGAYFQWDGIDDAGTGLAFPGAALNPGLNPVIDFTFGGIAQGIALTITSDQQIDYRVSLVDHNGVKNQYQFFWERNEPNFGVKIIYYTDPNWTLDSFNYADVAGIEIQIQTGTGANSNAPDTAFTSAFIFSFGITGNAGIRCNCGSAVNDQDLPNAQIDLLSSPGGALLQSTTTDANGDYSFFPLNPGTYQVCAHDTTAQYCTPRCSTVTIDPQNPSADYVVNFVKTQTTTFTVPPNVQGDCADCKIPDGTSNCPAYATTTGCLGLVTPVTVFQDVTTGNSCQLTIQRTFTSPDDGSQKTQTLTYRDTTPPQFSVNPQDETWPCNAITRTVNQWVAANADAVVLDDCSTTTVSNNWNGLPVGSCNSVTVTFTPRDACNNVGTARTATYSLTDTTGPVISTPASDVNAECAAKTNTVQSMLTSWLNRHADAVAADACSSATWTNDYAQLTPLVATSCLDFVDVTFTVRDACNNANSDIGRFTVRDTQSAVFTRAPQNQFQQCAGTTADSAALTNWLNTNAGATFTDACSVNDLDINISNDYGGQVLDECNDSLTVVFTIQDACGTAPVSAPATFSIQDTLSPVINPQAQPLTVECDGFGNVDDFDTWVNDHGGARATDQCGGITWTDDSTAPPSGTCLSSVLVTFTATDDCGRAVNTQASFTVRDATDPVFDVLPQDAGTECNANADTDYQDWLSNQAFASGTDLCDASTSITNTAGALVLGCNRPNTVSFFISDTCGNTSPAAQATFTVTDNFDPVITVPGSNLDLECNSVSNQGAYNSWLASNAGATAFDDCTPVTWSNDGAQTLTGACLFSQDVTFRASDQCGHFTEFTQTATITDTVAPVLLSGAQDQDIQCDTVSTPSSAQLYSSWVASHGFASARDDCTAVIWTDDAPTVLTGVDPCFATTLVTFTASDNCGASVSTQASFTIRDTNPPVIVQQASTSTVQCDPTANGNQFLAFIQNHGGAIIQDACSAVVWGATFTAPPSGCDSEIVTFSADDGCGSVVFTTATFSIVDTLNPNIITPAQNVQFECDGAGNVNDYNNYLATHGGAVAQDVCATSLTWSNNALGVGPVGCGVENIVFSVADTCGGRSSTTGTFRIVDTHAPVINPQASDQSAECDVVNNPVAIATWLVARGGADATDTCYSTGSLVWTNNYTSLVPLPCGAVATVTFSVRDPCGQVAGTTASFVVTDSFPPVITNPAQNLVLECNPATNNDDTLAWVNSRASASATDSCSAVQWSNSFVATPDPCTGPYVVGFTAADACGNRATTTASVTIQDTVPPSFVNFPPDVRVVCDEVTDSSMTGIPGFTDSCFTADVIRTESDSVEVLPFERLCPGDTIITRTWRITDACGNFAERDQLIVVSIPQGDCIPQPCIPCDEQPLLCCASSLEPVPCNPVECVPVDCTHTSCNTVPCLPVVCGNGSPPPFVDDDDVIAPSPRPQASDCEPIYIYVFDDDDGVTTQPVYTVSFGSSASTLTFSLFSLFLALLFLM